MIANLIVRVKIQENIINSSLTRPDFNSNVDISLKNLNKKKKKKLQSELPDLRIDSKLITRPTRPANKAQEPHLANLHR